MSFVPYTPDIQKWINHFTSEAARSGPRRAYYTVDKVQAGSGSGSFVKLVSPTEQQVSQAKASVKQLNEDSGEMPPYKRQRMWTKPKSKKPVKKKVTKKKTKKAPKKKAPKKSAKKSRGRPRKQ